MAIRFDVLKENEKNIQMGDPVYCKFCRNVFNSYSKLMSL